MKPGNRLRLSRNLKDTFFSWRNSYYSAILHLHQLFGKESHRSSQIFSQSALTTSLSVL